MLRKTLQGLADEAGARAVAVACYDWETGDAFDLHGDRAFHAASLMKVGVLLGVLDDVAEGRFTLDDRLHVRNRFVSAADGRPFRVAPERDADEAVHAKRGRTMRIGDLAAHMIRTSSNLATNLLLDLVGVEGVREALAARGCAEVVVRRGVEDERAFEAGIVNTATANALVRLFRAIENGEGISDASRALALDILFGQAFTSGIPSGLPDAVREAARVAHKTGSISTVQHDAGLVYLPERRPYALAVLTEWDADQTSGRTDLVAALARAVYDHLADA